MTEHKTARELRKDIGEIGFDFWVRFWKDGTIWIGCDYCNQTKIEKLCSKLNKLGYKTELNGKRHTSGEHIISVEKNKLTRN